MEMRGGIVQGRQMQETKGSNENRGEFRGFVSKVCDGSELFHVCIGRN